MSEEFDKPIDGGSYQRLANGRVRRIEASTAPALGKTAQRLARQPAVVVAAVEPSEQAPAAIEPAAEIQTTHSEPQPRRKS